MPTEADDDALSAIVAHLERARAQRIAELRRLDDAIRILRGPTPTAPDQPPRSPDRPPRAAPSAPGTSSPTGLGEQPPAAHGASQSPPSGPDPHQNPSHGHPEPPPATPRPQPDHGNRTAPTATPAATTTRTRPSDRQLLEWLATEGPDPLLRTDPALRRSFARHFAWPDARGAHTYVDRAKRLWRDGAHRLLADPPPPPMLMPPPPPNVCAEADPEKLDQIGGIPAARPEHGKPVAGTRITEDQLHDACADVDPTKPRAEQLERLLLVDTREAMRLVAVAVRKGWIPK